MTIPAVMTILDLATTATATSSMRLEASYTTASGNATTVQVALTQIMTSIFGGLPTGGGTGQILSKVNGADYSTQWSDIASAVLASTGLTAAGSTTVTVLFADATPLSVLGVAGTATAAPLPIVGTAGQVLRINDAGTAAAFGPVNLGNTSSVTGFLTVPFGGSGTTTLTAFGVVYGNGTSTVGITAAGTTAWALLGNGSALAPSFQQVSLTASVTGVLPLASGGWSTNTLTAFGVVYGSGTATPGITAAGTTAWPLVSNGTAAAPSFQLLNLTAGVTGNLALTNITSIGNSTVLGNVSGATATPVALTVAELAGVLTAPTVQRFTAVGGGVYTAASNLKFIIVEIFGGGGGGGGGGGTSTGGANGVAGGQSSFGTMTAPGGGGGTGGGSGGNLGNVGGGGAGGAVGTNGDLNVGGFPGSPGAVSFTTTAGGPGGSGGGWGAGRGQSGGTGTVGTGFGGGGGGGAAPAAASPGGGGGSGTLNRRLITAVLATTAFTVGAAGTPGAAGTGGVTPFDGGTAAAGGLVVYEFRQ